MEEGRQLLKIHEAVDLTNISRHCIEYLMKQGKVDSVADGEEILVDVQQLLRLKESAQIDG